MNTFCGVDIGGTSAKLCLLNTDRKIISKADFLTGSASGPNIFITKLCEKILDLNKSAGGDLKAIGIGCAGPLNYQSGLIMNPWTLGGLEGMYLTPEIKNRLHLPVLLDNDANTAHIGEVELLGKEDTGNTLLMTFGTGVGCSIRMNGKLFRVPGGVHPEIGHIPVGISSDIVCYCGKNNCMENILSGTAINRDAERLFQMMPEDVLDNPDSPEKQQYYENLIQAFTNAVTELVGIFNSNIVIVSGGMRNFFEKYLIKSTQKRIDSLLPIFGKTKIIPTLMGTDSGRFGAALMALDYFQENE